MGRKCTSGEQHLCLDYKHLFLSTGPDMSLDILVLRQIKKLSAAHSSEIRLQFLGTEVSNTESTSVLAALNILACLLTLKYFYIHRLVILFPVMHPALNVVGLLTMHLGHEMSKTSHKKRWAAALVPCGYQYWYGSVAKHRMGKNRVRFLVLPKGICTLTSQDGFHIRLFSVPEVVPLCVV